MTRKEMMKALKERNITFKATMKNAELETLLKESEMKEMTLKERLENMFKDSTVINAHGGFAVKIDNKRAFEITQSKRTNLYKICTHKDTTNDSKLRNLTRYRNQDIDVQEQKYCFAFKNLDEDAMKYVANKVYEAKNIKMMQYKKDAENN